MRFESVHLSFELPDGFERMPAAQGYEFVDVVRGEQIYVAVALREDLSVAAHRDAETTLAWRKAHARERSGGSAEAELVLEPRRGVERLGFMATQSTSRTTLWCVVAAYPRSVVMIDYVGERDDAGAVAGRARAVFESLHIDDRRRETVDANRIYIYPSGRALLDQLTDSCRQGGSRYIGELCFNVVERVDGRCRIISEDDLRAAGLSFSEAYVVGQLNVERDLLAGVFKLQQIGVAEEPVYLVNAPWAAATFASFTGWSGCAKHLNADDLTMVNVGPNAVLLQADHPHRARERLEPIRAELESQVVGDRLPSHWFHFAEGRLKPLTEVSLQTAEPNAAAGTLAQNLTLESDFEGVLAFRGNGRPMTPFVALMIQGALAGLGRPEEAYAYGESLRDPDGRFPLPEFAQHQMSILYARGDFAAGERIIANQLRHHSVLTCGELVEAQRLYIVLGRLDEARALGLEAMARLRASPQLWFALMDGAYNAACAHALCNEREAMLEVVRYLKKRAHPALHDLASDSDVAAFHDDEELRSLLSGNAHHAN